MALTTCPECQASVAPDAFVCPACSGPLLTARKVLWPVTRAGQIRRSVLLAVLAGLAAWQLLTRGG